jgi:hypothetical protein
MCSQNTHNEVERQPRLGNGIRASVGALLYSVFFFSQRSRETHSKRKKENPSASSGAGQGTKTGSPSKSIGLLEENRGWRFREVILRA